MKPYDREFQGLITQLVETLQEEVRQHQRLLKVVRKKKDAFLSEVPEELDSLLRVEREMLTNAVAVERDRIALVTELGQWLGHAHPARLRLAELILHADAESRDELLDLREEFRDVADELDDLVSADPIFTRHRKEQVRLYVTPSRSKTLLGAVATPIRRPARGTAYSPGRDGS